MKTITSILCVLLVLLQFRLWIGNGSLTEAHQLRQEKQAIVKQNTMLEARNNSLAAEVFDLKQGLDAIEERARSEMGMIKKDETFYQFIKIRQAPSPSPNQPKPPHTEPPAGT